ncbi:MAG: dihydrofolate reductase family protein, partial [Patescibacteria group bacterium]|nr:dihydrofolate reductase family protein [Patescibacteria group bacterium]
LSKVIVSHNKNLKLDDGFIRANSPRGAINILDKRGFKEVILCGGGVSNTAFARLGLIDEMAVNIEGVVIGRGVSLFAPSKFELPLRLVGIRKISSNIVQLRYKVSK